MRSAEAADDLKVCRAEAGTEKMRTFAAFDYAARSWKRERWVIARLEATTRGFGAWTRRGVVCMGSVPFSRVWHAVQIPRVASPPYPNSQVPGHELAGS